MNEALNVEGFHWLFAFFVAVVMCALTGMAAERRRYGTAVFLGGLALYWIICAALKPGQLT